MQWIAPSEKDAATAKLESAGASGRRGSRFPFGLPNTDNANYLWIQLFYTSPAPTGRAANVAGILES